jgi:hypothetical protein
MQVVMCKSFVASKQSALKVDMAEDAAGISPLSTFAVAQDDEDPWTATPPNVAPVNSGCLADEESRTQHLERQHYKIERRHSSDREWEIF